MSFDPEMFGQAMGEAIRKAVAPLHAEIEALRRQLLPLEGLKGGADGRDGKDGVDGVDGKDGRCFTLEDVRPIIDKAIEMACKDAEKVINDAIKAIPTPKDGADGKDGVNGIDGKDGADGKDGVQGDDGRDGEGGVDGKDGESFTLDDAEKLLDAKMARWELDFERRAQAALEKAIDRMPAAKDGKDGVDGHDGKNGMDGIGFDDLDVSYDGQRSVTIKFMRGDAAKEFTFALPVQLDRGVHKASESYEAGDGVTWGGSYWIAQKDNPIGKPGEIGSDGWRLAVKKGRDGKDGRNGIDKTAPVKLELKP